MSEARYGPRDDPKHWSDRAAHMRVLASQMNDIDAMAVMLKLADDYDQLADRADKLAEKPPEPKSAPRGRSPRTPARRRRAAPTALVGLRSAPAA